MVHDVYHEYVNTRDIVHFFFTVEEMQVCLQLNMFMAVGSFVSCESCNTYFWFLLLFLLLSSPPPSPFPVVS